MPAKSKQQQKFMGMVHALNKGDIKPSDVSKSVKDVAKNIKKSDAEDFASTKHSGLPRKVKEQILNAFKEYANKMSGNKLGGGGSHDYAPQKGLRDDDGYEDNEGPKDESVNEAKFYVTRNLGRGQGKSLVGGWDFKKDKKLPPKEFRTYKDAEKYIQKISRGGSRPGNPTAYFVTDKDMNMVDKKGKRKRMFEGMFSTLDQIRQDSKDVRDFVKNVFKDRDFMKMKNDKEFIKYLKSIYEGTNESKGVPQNYMQGRTSDYHTALRGKNRDYSGGTNFKKNNHGQPDIENDDEDQETNQLSVQQTPVKEAKLDHHRISGNSIELLVRHNREKLAIRFKDKRILDKMGFDWSKPKNIEKLLSLKKLPKGMSISRSFHESINEVKVETERYFGKKGIIIMIRDGNKLISAIFKDKKNADKFNRNNPSDVKKLYQLAKKTKFPKTIDEYGQRLDLSYLEDEEARLKGTPKPKDAIDRDIEEYSGGSYEYTKGDQYGQNSIDEAGVFPVTNYIKGIIPPGRLNTNTPENKKNSEKLVKDLRNTLNKFWKQHDIPFKIR